MKRLFPLFALFAVVLALWWSTTGSRAVAPVGPVPAATSAEHVDPPAPLSAEMPEPARSVIDDAREPQVEEPGASEAAAPTCSLLGHVVDADGQPLADVLVQASAWRTWREGTEAPRLESSHDLHGYEVHTDATGAFRIDAPVPTAEAVAVSVLPDRFHDSWITRLGTTSGCDGPPLGEGPRDLGEIRLVAAGAIRGRVTDESGAPLEGVELSTGSQRGHTYDRGGRTEADGTYLVPHAVVGTYGVSTKLEGYLSQLRTPVTVEADRDTIGIDFVLKLAPSIAGIVVDDAGRPVAGAKLWGWPTSGGQGAGGKSGADGRFVVDLPQDEPYRFSVKCDGYATWDQDSAEETTLQPGAHDLRIVLQPVRHTRFLVIDAETGEPIERYGLGILENNGSKSKQLSFTEKRPPRPSDHPGGVFETTARPGIDQYIVAADGYLLQYADVAHLSPGDPSQTIRMQRTGTVRGRVVRDGAPVAGAVLTLFGTFRVGRPGPDGSLQPTVLVDRNKQSATSTGDDGRFALAAPTRSGMRLVVAPHQGAPLVVDDIAVRPGEEHDLGDLELQAGATLEGQVLLPLGIDPSGLAVFLGDPRDEVKTGLDAQGRFRFEELAAGASTVSLGGRPGQLAGGAHVECDLRAGEITQVTIDARDRAMCEVSLRIDLGDLEVKGIQVDLLRDGESPEQATLGQCDDQGRVHGFARAWGEARVAVHLVGAGFRTLEHPDLRLQLVAGAKLDEVVRFELGTLRILLPQGVALPNDGTLRLVLEPESGRENAQTVRVSCTNGAPKDDGGLAAAVPGGVEIRAIPAGRWNVRLSLEESDTEPTRVQVGAGFRFERTPYFTRSAAADLHGDETVELRM